MSKSIILFPGKLSEHAGGPGGYLAILREGLMQIASPVEIFAGEISKTKKRYRRRLTERLFVWGFAQIWVERLRRWNRCRLEKRHLETKPMKDELVECKKWIETPFEGSFLEAVQAPDVRAIHVHTILDACRLKTTIDAYRLDKKIILTTHTPESFAIERDNALEMKNYPEGERRKIFDLLSQAEICALRDADFLIYPSREALDPLFETIEGFADLIANKRIFYVPTGANSLATDISRQKARSEYDLSDDTFVISFVGRHIGVKGYDLLQQAAKRLFGKHPNLRFFVAGTPLNLDPCLEPPYWVELGYIDPRNLLRASDCFVLPNRRTFYDLVLLEALSAGVPTIASATGGNKSIARECASLKTFSMEGDPVKNLVRSIEDMLRLSADQRETIGRDNAQYYQTHHTPKVFARNYDEAVRQINAMAEKDRA